MKNYLTLFLTILTLNCFGAGLTVSTTNGFSVGQTLSNAIFIGDLSQLIGRLALTFPTNSPTAFMLGNKTFYYRGTIYQFTNSTTDAIMEAASVVRSNAVPFNNGVTPFSAFFAANTTFHLTTPVFLTNMHYYWQGCGNHSSMIHWEGPENWTTIAGMTNSPESNACVALLSTWNGGYDDFYNISDCTVKDLAFTMDGDFPCFLLVAGGERGVIQGNVFSAQNGLNAPPGSSLSVVGCLVAGISGCQIEGNSFYSLADGAYIPLPENQGSQLAADSLFTFKNNEGYSVGADDNGHNTSYPDGIVFKVGALLMDGPCNNSSIIEHNHLTSGGYTIYLGRASDPVLGSGPRIIDTISEATHGELLTVSNAQVIMFQGEPPNLDVVDGNYNTTGANNTNVITHVQNAHTNAIYSGRTLIYAMDMTGHIKAAGFTGDGSGITNATTSYPTNDLVNGRTNINNTTHTVLRTIPVKVSSPATTLGSAEIDAQLFIGGAWITVDDLDIAGGATSVIATNKTTLKVVIPPGGSLRLTNTASGTGYVAGFDASATNTYTLLP